MFKLKSQRFAVTCAEKSDGKESTQYFRAKSPEDAQRIANDYGYLAGAATPKPTRWWIAVMVILVIGGIVLVSNHKHISEYHLQLQRDGQIWLLTNRGDQLVVLDEPPVLNGSYAAWLSHNDNADPTINPETTNHPQLRQFRWHYPLSLRVGESIVIGAPPPGIELIYADVKVIDDDGDRSTVRVTAQ